MQKLLLLLILSFFSAQSFAGSCPDGSEPVKSVSSDGSYFVYNCSNNSNDDGAIKPTTDEQMDLISFNSYAEVPPIIGGNTMKDICKIADCVGGETLHVTYMVHYFTKPRHKAFVINVVDNGKTINGYYVGYGFPSWMQAKQNILAKCKAVFASKNCRVLFIDYQIADKELYKLLTTISIPPNAYKSGNSWKCNTGFTKDGDSCNKVEESMDYFEELQKIKELLISGVINEEDFEKMKQKIIDNM